MNAAEILLIGTGLSMDAIAVSISNVLAYRKTRKARLLAMPLFFGLFQGIMPLLGFFTGTLFYEIIRKYSGFVTLLILGFIGLKMINDANCEDEQRCTEVQILTYGILFFQAVATSIDAFAVGVSFCAAGVHIFTACLIIALTTLLLSAGAVFAGKKAKALPQDKAMITGGIILIIIGIKSFFL